MTTAQRVSVIICTRNRAASLRETLASVGRVRVPTDMPAELLVVDNGSSDHTRQVVEQAGLTNMPVRCIHEPTPGQCHARNRGIAESQGDILLWTDDDVRVPEDWIEGMCRPILSGEADAVAGGVRLAPHLERAWMTEMHRGWLGATDRLDPSAPSDMVGANMAFGRRVLRAVSGFDPCLGPGALGFCDDTFFSLRAKSAGLRLVARLDTVVEHHLDTSRLCRSSWVRMAVAKGASGAYMASRLDSACARFRWRSWVRLQLCLVWLRLTNLPALWCREGCPVAECRVLRDLAYISFLWRPPRSFG